MSYTEEQLEFIKNAIDKHSFEKVTYLFNLRFKCRVTVNSIRILCHRKGWHCKFSRTNTTFLHPPIVHKLADFFYTDYPIMARLLQSNRIKDIEFYKLVTSEDLIHRRDEFYKYFKSENTADYYWTNIWDNGRRVIC